MIRAARQDEIAMLSDLAFRSKAVWGYSKAFMEACRLELSVAEEDLPHTYVLEGERGVAGFYTLSGSHGDHAELELLFVEPSGMRRGVGSALLTHAREQARARGCSAIVIQGDPNATAFYAAAGAIRVGARASASIANRQLPLFLLPC